MHTITTYFVNQRALIPVFDYKITFMYSKHVYKNSEKNIVPKNPVLNDSFKYVC